MSQIINESNLYIKIADTGSGTLTGDSVDPKLVKADRLLAFSETISRAINPASENSLFAAGQLGSTEVTIKILRTSAAITGEGSLIAGANVTPITVYRTAVIGKKLTVTEEIVYTDCIFTSSTTNADASDDTTLDTLTLTFRYQTRQDTVTAFDQNGAPQGNTVSFVDYPKGGLVPPAGGGGGAAAPA